MDLQETGATLIVIWCNICIPDMNLQFAIDFLPLVLRAEHRGFPGLSIPPQKLPEQERGLKT